MSHEQKGGAAGAINLLALALAFDDQRYVDTAIVTLQALFPRENEGAQEDEPLG